MKFRLVEEQQPLNEDLKYLFNNFKKLITKIKRAKHAENISYKECLELLQMLDKFDDLTPEEFDILDGAADYNDYYKFAMEILKDPDSDEYQSEYSLEELVKMAKDESIKQRIWKLVKKYFKGEL